jgi:hypothetical protein
MKTCNTCKVEQPLSNFHKRTYSSGTVATQTKCKTCSTVSRKKYYKPHSKIKSQLNLSWEEVEEITLPGKCATCGSTNRLCIDHDHKTNKPRGLLCHNCNTALGLVGDNLETLTNLIEYLK